MFRACLLSRNWVMIGIGRRGSGRRRQVKDPHACTAFSATCQACARARGRDPAVVAARHRAHGDGRPRHRGRGPDPRHGAGPHQCRASRARRMRLCRRRHRSQGCTHRGAASTGASSPSTSRSTTRRTSRGGFSTTPSRSREGRGSKGACRGGHRVISRRSTNSRRHDHDHVQPQRQSRRYGCLPPRRR